MIEFNNDGYNYNKYFKEKYIKNMDFILNNEHIKLEGEEGFIIHMIDRDIEMSIWDIFMGCVSYVHSEPYESDLYFLDNIYNFVMKLVEIGFVSKLENDKS